MLQLAENKPGPHRWATQIAAWAHGRLVQWRYEHDHQWHDCMFPSAGMPNWENPDLMFRVAPEDPLDVARRALQSMQEAEAKRRAALPPGACHECDGDGVQGGQFCGGYWACEACGGTGKKPNVF